MKLVEFKKNVFLNADQIESVVFDEVNLTIKVFIAGSPDTVYSGDFSDPVHLPVLFRFLCELDLSRIAEDWSNRVYE